VHLREGRFEPARIVVVGDGAAVAGAIARYVGRVGDHEVDSARLHPAHDLDAVAVRHGVEPLRRVIDERGCDEGNGLEGNSAR